MQKELIKEPTEKDIEAWKKKYQDVYLVTTEEGVTAYLRKPDRKTLSFAMKSGQKDPLKFNEAILNNCLLGGTMDMTDDDQFMAVSGKLDEIVTVKEAEIKKL
jgi:hypothetical protein